MERGVRLLLYILAGALVIGGVVLFLHPDYRGTVRAWASGDITAGPIWESNRAYYPETGWEEGGDEH